MTGGEGGSVGGTSVRLAEALAGFKGRAHHRTTPTLRFGEALGFQRNWCLAFKVMPQQKVSIASNFLYWATATIRKP